MDSKVKSMAVKGMMKMRKKTKTIAALLMTVVFSIGLTGCAENQIPDLTDAQIQAVGEYVAVTLMKYDAGHRSRLMDLSKYKELDENPDGLEEGESNAPETGMKPVDDTPVVDSAGKETADAINSLEQALELPEGVTITYIGEKVCAYYPEDNGDPYFSLNAAAGKRLLVLIFSIMNSTEQEQELDLMSLNAIFRITVNGEYTRKSLTTLMDNDLATYREPLPSGESCETVLVIEMEEDMAENISSISLDVKNDTKAYKVQLL